MYKSFYKLESKPFELKPDPLYLWLGEKYKEALSILRYGILENKGFLLLTGDDGTGKTTLINTLTKGLGQDVEWAIISDPNLEKIDFYNKIATNFGIKKQFSSKVQFLIQFSHFLHKSNDEGKKVVLLIDDCHQLSQDMLEELRLLSNIEKSDTKLINIFFVGRPSFNEMLIQPNNKAVRQRLTLKARLIPLDVNETGDYVQHRLKVGGTEEKIFTAKAIQVIHKYSRGIPLRINVICDHALLGGSAKGKKGLDHKLLLECVQKLNLPANPSQKDFQAVSKGEKQEKQFREKFLHGGVDAMPSITGFNVEDGRGKGWLVYMGLFVAFVGVGLYLWHPTANLPDVTAMKEEVAAQKKVVSSVKKVTAPPVNAVLEKNDTTINEQKAAALKNAILTKAYSEDTQKEQVLVGAEIEDLSDTVVPEPPPEVITEPEVVVEQVALEESVQEEITVAPVMVERIEEEIQTPFVEEEEIVVGESIEIPEEVVEVQVVDPAPVLPPLEPRKIILGLQPNSLRLTRQANKVFSQFVEVLMGYPNARVLVKGYVSSDNDTTENKNLSADRATGVQKLLIENGINEEQIEVRGMGVQDPLASNSTSAGRRKNRRVEIEVISDGTM